MEDNISQNETDFADLISGYNLTYGRELEAKLSRLDGIIGDSHWLSVGTYKENMLRIMLRNRLPKKYEIGTGFVLNYENKKRVISRQLDILIWDHQDHSPFFRDGEFVIVPPEACVAAIEVKSTLSSDTLREALENLDSLMQFFPDHFRLRNKVLHRSIFAYSLDKRFNFPSGVFNSLHSSYQKSKNIRFSRRIDFYCSCRERWQLPWLSAVSVLGVGSVHCDEWLINGKPHIVHTAYRADPNNDRMDAYALLERSLMLSLLYGYGVRYKSDSRPGTTKLLFANKATHYEGKWFMAVPPVPVEKVIRDGRREDEQAVSQAYRPRLPRRKSAIKKLASKLVALKGSQRRKRSNWKSPLSP